MTTYTAHATMRNGTARLVHVTAADQIEARRKMFALSRMIVSITAPSLPFSLEPSTPRVEYMRRAGDGSAQ